MSSAAKRKQPTGSIFGAYVDGANKENLLDDFPAPAPAAKKASRQDRSFVDKPVELPRRDSPPPRARPAPTFSQEEEDDEAINVKRMLEQLQKSKNKKASKTREKLESVVEDSFHHLEDVINDAVKAEEVAFLRAQEETAKEFRRVQSALQSWSSKVMNTTNAYHTAMQELAHDFDKLVNTFQKSMQDIQTKALSSSEHKNRMSALTSHCREVMNGLKDEVSKKTDRGGLNNNAQLLLFQALMNN